MSSTAFNPLSQMLDMAAVLAAHERAGEHAAVTRRIVRPLDDDQLDRMDMMAAMETEIYSRTEADVDDGHLLKS